VTDNGDPSSDLRPARGYSWPPFEVGHFVPVKSGARSPRIVASLSAAVADAIVEDHPWLADRRHALALSQLAGAEATRLLLQDYHERLAAEKGAGAISPRMVEAKATAERLAAKLAERVGVTPMGRARLAAVAVSAELGEAALADLAATGRQTPGFLANEARLLDATATDSALNESDGES
jgi:hypothetical protein